MSVAAVSVGFFCMSSVAIILVVISAFIHALWNLTSKQRHPSAGFFLIASLSGSLFLAPLLWLYQDAFLPHVPARVWIYLVITGFFSASYFISLAGAYRSGDMSMAYPLARSSPVIVVTIVTLILGRGDQVTGLSITGIVLVVAGCFLIPMRNFSDFRILNYWNQTCGLALLAAISTAGYSIMDDQALRILRHTEALNLDVTRTTLLYSCLEYMSAFLWIALFIAVRRKERRLLAQVMRNDRRYAALAGVLIVTCYALVLISLAFAKDVSYVVGFRQLSIPVGTVFAILFLKEPACRPKMTGVLVMFAGLLLIALG